MSRFALVRWVAAGLLVANTGLLLGDYLGLRIPILFFLTSLPIPILVAAWTSIAFWRTGMWRWALALLGVVVVLSPFMPLPFMPLMVTALLNLAAARLMVVSIEVLPAYPKTSRPPNVAARKGSLRLGTRGDGGNVPSLFAGLTSYALR